MPSIYHDKLRADKIYKTPKVYFHLKNGLNRAIAVINDSSNVDEFVETTQKFVFNPASSKKINFPPFKFSLPSFRESPNTSVRDSHYAELRSHKVVFNKLQDFSNIPENYNEKPIFADMSLFREEFNRYAIVSRKSPNSLFGTLRQTLTLITEYIKKGKFPNTTYITVTPTHDPFLNTLLLALRSQYKLFAPLMDELDIVLISNRGYIYKPNFSGKNAEKLKATNLRLMSLLVELATSTNDVRYAKEDLEDLGHGTEGEDLESLVIVQDENDKEQSEILKAKASKDDWEEPKTPETTSDDEELDDVDAADKAQSTSTDEDSEENGEADNTTETTEDDIIGADVEDLIGGGETFGGSYLEMERLRKEREEFLTKNMHRQEAALKDVEALADKLSADKSIDALDVNDNTIISSKVKQASLTGLTTSYYRKQFLRDLLNCIKVLNNDPEFPAVVTKFEMKNISTPLAKLDELRVEFLDKSGKRHNWVVDVPKLSRDGFLYFGGNRKFIAKQATPVPVIKETHDRVQITTNYKKTFLYRKGEKTSGQADRILRVLLNSDFKSVERKYGNSVVSNGAFPVSIPYNYMAKKYLSLKITNPTIPVLYVFNQAKLREMIAEAKYTLSDEYCPIGWTLTSSGEYSSLLVESLKDRKIFTSSKDGKKLVPVDDDFVSNITRVVKATEDEELIEAYKNTKQSAKLSYTDIKIAGTSMNLGVLIALYKGLIPALDSYSVKYHVEDKRIAKKDSEIMLAFKDAYLYIDAEYNPAKEILVNGLLFLNTAGYTLNETDAYAPVYLDYLEEVTSSRNTAKALDNFKSSMIDPITLETLTSMGLPEQFPELLLYGNTLLGELSHSRKNNMRHFRIRDSEVVTVAIYNSLMDAFNGYKRSKRTGMVQPISSKRDSVTKLLQSMTNVEDYSTLNPFLEAELKSKTTFKGPSGLNSSDAYTAEIRAYDETMLGLYGIYTPIGPEVGVNRSMVLNPKIETTRGFIRDFDVDASDSTNLFSIGELLNVFTPKHADAPRAVMATVQGKHLTPTKVQHPYMIGNGTDRLLPHLIGEEFARKAVDDGVIEQINKSTNLCVIKYKDGTRSIVDLAGKVAKNSGGGFYTENRLQLTGDLKVGSKVKKGQIVAIDHNFFKETADNSVGFAGGYLAKIAVAALPETFEDSGIFTNDLVDGLSTDVMNERPVVLNKNTRLIKMANIGDKVEVNDSLVIFEDVGDNEELALKALEKLDAATSKDIDENARQTVSAKFTGEIFDIHVYYNRNIEDLHPTLQKVINDYSRKYKAKAKLIETGRDDEIVQQPSTERIDADKILGTDVDGVMFQFFIRHNDKFKVGDKACFAIALKTICAETVEEGKEPYSAYRKDENVQAIISPLSLVSRMVPDLYLIGYCNKAIVELQRQVIDILEA